MSAPVPHAGSIAKPGSFGGGAEGGGGGAGEVHPAIAVAARLVRWRK